MLARIVLVLALTASSAAAKPKSGYVDVNGVHMYYYEIQGRGDPLFMLHGGVDPDQFGPNIEALAKTHEVIIVHLQGHGNTSDTDPCWLPTSSGLDARGYAALRWST